MLKKINYVLNAPQKLKMGLLIFVYLFGSVFELMGVALIMPFVNVISDTSVLHSGGIYNKIYIILKCQNETEFILLFATGLIVVYVIKNTYIILSNAFTTRFTVHCQKDMSMNLMRYYMKQPYLYHAATNIAKITRGMDVSVNMFFTTVTATIQLVSESVVALLIVGYLVILDKSITIGVIFLLGLFSVFYIKIFKKRILFYGKQFHYLTAEKNKWTRQSFEGIKEIKVANSEGFYIHQVDDVMIRLRRMAVRNQIINSVPRPLFEMVCVSAMMIVVMFKISREVRLSYFMPVLSAFAIAAFRLLPSFSRVTTLYNTIMYNKVGVEEVYSNKKDMEQDVYTENEVDNIPVVFDKEVVFENVSFRYPEAEEDVFTNVNMHIKKNSSVALIGPSGAGKTTLVDVFLGLMDPKEGKIMADGTNVYEHLFSWHRLLGYIPQNIYLIDDTIRNNIVFGIPKEEVSDERIWKAINDAQLTEFVSSLPKGLDTLVGERGVRVSGGQRQRIGIARALYSNPQILVLDEATSALDTDTETAVMEAIDNLKGNKTMIIIAHRLTTIRNCDYIYEIKDKRIVLKEKEEVFYSN